MDRYETLKAQMADALGDLAILAGDEVGPSDVSWQDVAGTAAINLRTLANLIDAMRNSDTHYQGSPLTGPVVFPSPADLLEAR